jgi:hypothetical protein
MDLRRQKRLVSVCLANGPSYSPHFPRALNVALWGLDGHRAQVIDAFSDVTMPQAIVLPEASKRTR